MTSSDKDKTDLQTFIKEAWLLVDIFGGTDGRGGTSTVPAGSPSESSRLDRKLSSSELTKDQIEKYRIKFSTYQPKLTAIIGDPDFQPISFLQSGLLRGQAVCRIVIHLSLQDLDRIIERLREITPDEKICSKFQKERVFNPVRELETIFALPNDFFSELPCKHQPLNQITFSQALDFLSERKESLLALNPFALGTGFLVGETQLLTNHHVLSTIAVAQQCVAQFRYEDGARAINVIEYDFDPRQLFVSDPGLDYTLVQLKSNPYTKRMAGFEFDWIDLTEIEKCAVPSLNLKDLKQIERLAEKLKSLGYEEQWKELIALPHDDDRIFGDRTAIIEHPRGRKKEIVLNNNGITKKTWNNLEYETDTDYGSSGSPVFNLNWELIAITKEVVPRLDESRKGKESWSRFIASKGTRMVRIIEDLKKKSVRNTRLQAFIANFVTTSESLDYPPLPAAVEFDGVSDCVITRSLNQQSEPSIDDFSQFTIEAWVNPHLSSTNTTIFSQVFTEPWYEEFGGDSVFGRYLLSLQLTSEGNVVFSREPFWQIFSASFASYGVLYPPIEQKHPLEILTSNWKQGKEEENVKISLVIDRANPVEVRELEDKIKSLQCILYCLGFLDASACSAPEAYRKKYYRHLTGVVDIQTSNAITKFNTWCFKGELAIQPTEEAITISSEAIDLFKKRGSFLGLGTRGVAQTTEETQYENHHGLRVLELQYCLRSLDWNSPYFDDQKLPKSPNILLDGDYSWAEKWTEPSAWLEATDTTAYAVKRLQQAYRQPNDAVFGPSALLALRQAKTYRVMTREKLPLHKFSHVAATFDGTEVKLYINGQLANRRYTSKHSVGRLEQAIIGARPSSPTTTDQPGQYESYFAGRLTEVRSWNMNLQAKDIAKNIYQRLYSAENIGLIGYWRPEEVRLTEVDHQATGDREKNYLSYIDNFAAARSTVYASKSEFQTQYTNQSVNVRSACDFPAVPLPFGLNVTHELALQLAPQQEPIQSETPQGITVGCWLKFGYGEGDIIRGEDPRNGHYTIKWMNRKIQLELWRSNHDHAELEIQAVVPNIQAWHHIAFSWSASSGEVRLYLDGKPQMITALQAQVKKLNNQSIISFPAQPFSFDQQQIKILPGRLETAEIRDFNCSIAELRVWQVVRTPSEIKANFNQRLDSQNNLVGYWRFDGTDLLSFKEMSWITSQSKQLRFIDLTDSEPHWASPFIKGLEDLGLLGGFIKDDAIQFNPDQCMTKPEFIVLLLNVFGGTPSRDRARVILQLQDQTTCEYHDDIEYVWRLQLISGELEQESNLSGEDSSSVRKITFATDISKAGITRGQVFDAIFDSIEILSETSDAAKYERVLMHLIDTAEEKQKFSWIAPGKIATGLQHELIVSQTADSKQLGFQNKASRGEIAAMLYQALVCKQQAPKIESLHILKVANVEF